MKRALIIDRSQESLPGALGVSRETVAQIQALADANHTDAFDLYEQLAQLDLSEEAWLLAVWYVGYCHGQMKSVESPDGSIAIGGALTGNRQLATEN
jgi:hypothetical protein